ncbi:SMP-30/gluconolactonase/LRE family protein [Nesterenkonia sp. HG001]|uniref:SMP-30/gluconolactonase/LRE family protein n=1 Tax=Nesterenkonia sp. HG001 TaxID=2983207 RepID=UPI002AC657E0|nr:SMP-30/gluconolactonase/LRE family protein [Nesterenkonia sp. HG001]MDZ5078242.1 SMP-30/gluconolactonase/LRE family protein [Nesterenkonia sp. HG001]
MTSTLRLEDLLEPHSTLRQVGDGATWSEGPCWVPDAGVVRWSDIPGDRILQYDPGTGETTVHRDGVEFTNGRTLRPDGAVVQCSHGLRRVEVEVAGEEGAVVTPVVERWAEGRFNSPNDVVVASDGAVWFTDPPYGIVNPEEGHPGEMEYGGCHVFRVDSDTGLAEPMITDMGDPNGLAFSPDESVLYVSDTLAARKPGEGNPHHVRAYPVIRDGGAARTGRAVRCGQGRTLFEIADGVPDGIRVDEAGRIWSSAGDGVHLYSPSGQHLGHLPVPEVVANLCFGGPDGMDLYIAATSGLYHQRVRVRDAAWRG